MSQSVWAAITEYYRLGGLQTTEINFLTVLETGKSKIRMPAWSGWVRTPFWIADGPLLIVSSHGRAERGRKLPCDSYKGTNPICEGSTLMTSSNANYIPKDLSPNAIILENRVSTYEFGEEQTFSP